MLGGWTGSSASTSRARSRRFHPERCARCSAAARTPPVSYHRRSVPSSGGRELPPAPSPDLDEHGSADWVGPRLVLPVLPLQKVDGVIALGSFGDHASLAVG